MVFAHRTLARFCDEQGIEYQQFKDFSAILLATRELASERPTAHSRLTPQFLLSFRHG